MVSPGEELYHKQIHPKKATASGAIRSRTPRSENSERLLSDRRRRAADAVRPAPGCAFPTTRCPSATDIANHRSNPQVTATRAGNLAACHHPQKHDDEDQERLRPGSADSPLSSGGGWAAARGGTTGGVNRVRDVKRARYPGGFRPSYRSPETAGRRRLERSSGKTIAAPRARTRSHATRPSRRLLGDPSRRWGCYESNGF